MEAFIKEDLQVTEFKLSDYVGMDTEVQAGFMFILMEYFDVSEAYWNGHPDKSCAELEAEREELAAQLQEMLAQLDEM